MNTLRYYVELLEPVLATAMEGDPNSAVSSDYLSGSVLRGAAIAKYLQQRKLSELDAVDQLARRLFFDGKVRYLNGYLLDRQGRRCLPTPLSWYQKKYNTDEITDFAQHEVTDESDDWVRVATPFCSLDTHTSSVRLISPTRRIAIHTARTRRFGRAMPATIPLESHESPGAVYRYDSLAAGQKFEAVVLCNDDAEATIVEGLLDGEAILGGSRSAGYGRVTFERIQPEDQTTESSQEWRETGTEMETDLNDQLIVTFLSSVLIRDQCGQFVVDPDILTSELSGHIGCSLDLRASFLQSEAIGGFNRKWGLPLPQQISVKMGSVLVYESPDCDLITTFQRLEAEGIGERRSEGFGRLAISWHRHENLMVDATKPRSLLSPVPITNDSRSADLANRMVGRMLQRHLDEKLVELANKEAITKPPHRSQISRLRQVIQDELMSESAPHIQRIKDYLGDVERRKTPRGQFEQARIRGKSLLDWLKTALNTNKEDWTQLFGLDQYQMPKIGDISVQVTDELRARYLLQFIDAVLARAAKTSLEEGGE